MTKRLYISLYFLFGAILLSHAQQQSQIQSSFIYHFTNYMEWPSTKQEGDFVITIVGEDPIENFLKALSASKKVGLQNITVKKVTTVASISTSHIIYIANSALAQFDHAKNTAAKKNALLITSKQGYAKRGSGINFVAVNGKPKFEINETAITASSIKVGAKLLQIGIKID